MSKLTYHHVDVFSPTPFSGNSLAVFPDVDGLSQSQMLAITQEMRHFESIFLRQRNGVVRARVFDLVEELDFAGHPLIGAASVLHHTEGGDDERSWTFELNAKTVTIATRRTARGFSAVLDQGVPEFMGLLPKERYEDLAAALNLTTSDLSRDYPPEIVSTGLRYLVLPIASGLEHARIVHPDFGTLLESAGAQFVYVLDINALEARHWNNDGIIEDIATGSGAGTAAAYAVKHGRLPANREFVLSQGRFVGRPSQIRIRCDGSRDDIRSVLVGGDVAFVGTGTIEAPEARP